MTIYTLTENQCLSVCGAGANSGTENVGNRKGGIGNRSSGGKGGAPNTCENNIGMGLILGSLGTLVTGGNVLAGAALGGVGAGLGSCDNSPYHDSAGGSRNSSDGTNYGAQCTW